MLAGLTATKRWPLERIYEMFPRLEERRRSRGTDLSGGEQQMLAIAPRAGARSEDHPAGRAVRGAGAGHRARPARQPAASSPRPGRRSCWSSRTWRRRWRSRSRVYIINNGHIAHEGSAERDQGRPASAAALPRRVAAPERRHARSAFRPGRRARHAGAPVQLPCRASPCARSSSSEAFIVSACGSILTCSSAGSPAAQRALERRRELVGRGTVSPCAP